jgi:hypothetical protein
MEGYTIQHEEIPVWFSRSARRFIRTKYPLKQAASIQMVYDALCELAGDNSRGLWPIRQIARVACLSYPTASKGMGELESCGLIRVQAQRDEKGHQKPSLITLLTRTSLDQESQTKRSPVGDVLEQKNTSKGALEIKSKEPKDLQTPSPIGGIDSRTAIKIFCDERNLQPKYKGQKYVVTGRDAGEVGKIFKGPTPPTEQKWRENLSEFWKAEVQFTGNHNLSVFSRNFNLYSRPKETRGFVV